MVTVIDVQTYMTQNSYLLSKCPVGWARCAERSLYICCARWRGAGSVGDYRSFGIQGYMSQSKVHVNPYTSTKE